MHPDRKWPSTRQSLLIDINGPGRQDAWQELVAVYGPLIFRFAKRKGLSLEDAEDVAQEVLLKITRFQYDSDRGRFRSWLATVAARQIRDRHQKNSNARKLPVAGAAEVEQIATSNSASGWDEIFFERILEVACRRIRSGFDDDHWYVFTQLHTADESSQFPDASQIANALDRTVGWVYKANHKVTSRLKQEISRLVEDQPGFSRNESS